MYYGKMMSDQAHPARHQANSYNRKKHKKTDKKGKHKCKSDKECDPGIVVVIVLFILITFN